MCQTVGMQHDGDLGAIVRSAGCSIGSGKSTLEQASSSSSTQFAAPSSPKMGAGGFMELITGGNLMPDLAGFTHQQPGFLEDTVKKEPDLDTADYDIFSQGRSLSFVDELRKETHHTGSSSFGSNLFQRPPSLVKTETTSNDLAAFECGSPVSPILKESENNTNNSSSANPGKHQGSKRSRKMQQKRTVLVPVSGGGKPTGEVLPSDMWAWRKYGQKPIKGSPYPRGYYRCSSSKGCSARKQVERNRHDPTMLIITYTSEHNHPWPAHRNSLAGTTRIRPIAASAATASPSDPKREPELTNNGDNQNPFVSIVNSDPMQVDQHSHHRNLPHVNHHLGFDNTSRSSSQEEDFFSELEELPELSSILDKSFLYKSDEEGAGSPKKEGEVKGRTVVDPFNLFNWSTAKNPEKKEQEKVQQ